MRRRRSSQDAAFLTRSRSACAFIVDLRDQGVQICLGRLWLSNVGRGLLCWPSTPTKATRSLPGGATPAARGDVQTAPVVHLTSAT